MMRYLVLLFMLALTLISSSAQSVLGIPFGSSYDETKSALQNRFGKYAVHEEGGLLKLMDFEMGGFLFNFGDFEFQYGNNKTYLNAADFQRYYPVSEKDQAIKERDYLYSLLMEKYEDEYLEEFKNEQGFKCYKFGLNPFDSTKVLGVITLERGLSREGKEKLYLHLTYFPIYYLDKSSDF